LAIGWTKNDEQNDEQNNRSRCCQDGALQRRLHIGGFLPAQLQSALLSALLFVLLSFGALIFHRSRVGWADGNLSQKLCLSDCVSDGVELSDFQVIILVCRRLGLESCNLEEYQQGALPG
jgi:hypothetical protein